MGTRWHVQSHEDRFSEAIPDLSFGARGVNGWIELKQVKAWPKREDTKVKPAHYTSEQANWIIKRNKYAGSCFVFVKVEREYFLFKAYHARLIKNGITKKQYGEYCCAKWAGSIDPQKLLEALICL